MKKRSSRGKAKIRVMLVDDHAGMREALRTTINSEPDLIVVAEANGGHNALELFSHTNPDVVLMDGSMPEMNGIEATRQLRQLQPAARIIGLTLYEESAYLEEMVAAGVRGYVSKTDAPVNVVKAVRAVAAGRTYFDKDIPLRASGRSSIPRQQPVIEELTADELAVIKRVADGHTNVEIVADLKLPISAVEKYRTTAMKKLNLHTRTELARMAALRDW